MSDTEYTTKGKEFDYSTQNIGKQIIEEYEDSVINCVTGKSGVLDDISRLNEFCSHMGLAALEGDPYGVAFSCFAKHGSPFDQYLPIPIEMMNEDAFGIFVNLLSDFHALGWSKSANIYVENNIESVKKLADHGDPCAQWLSATWYKPDDFEINEESIQIKRLSLFEKSATAGFIPAIISISQFYLMGDDASIPVDLKKGAYWCRQGALQGNADCAFNLGVMYSEGMHVSKNKSVASLWLSTAYNNTNDSTVGIPRSYILEYSKSHNIELVTNPDLRFDPELVSNTAEFSNSNEDYKNTDFFTLLTYRIPEYHTQGEDEVFIDNFIINGVDADPEDFGDFRGIGEGQMMRMRMKKVDMFIPKSWSRDVSAKYGINEEEYDTVSAALVIEWMV